MQRPLVGVSSLAALALEGPADAELLCCAVVKKGELYVGRYRHASAPLPTGLPIATSLVQLAPETSLTVAQLAAALVAAPDARALGPALVDYRAELERLGVAPAQLLPQPTFTSAVALAALATLPPAYRKEDVFALEPHYLRGSGAEENPKFPPLAGVDPRARLKEE